MKTKRGKIEVIDYINNLNYFQLTRVQNGFFETKEEVIAELLDSEAGRLLGDKINELVEAVNKLNEKL